MAVHRPVSGPAQYGATAPTLRCTKGDGKPAVSRRMPGAGLSLWRPGRPRLIGQPSSRTGENPPYGMRGGIEETSASFEARSAPRSYPTRAMVELYCSSFRQVPKRIVLDIDDTFDAVHGGQQLRLFNAHHDEYGFQPIVVFDGEGRMVAALLRPACRPSGRQIVFWLRRLIAALRDNWPRVEILLRADSHYCTPEVLRFCRAEQLDYVLGVAPTTTLRQHVAAREASTTAHAAKESGEKLRRFKEFYDGAASWDRVEHIIARVEAGPQGVDTRFIVTSLDGVRGRTVYQDIYCARGQAENHIKAWKTHLAADRTSCCRATANQMRLFLHIGAYWLLWSLRAAMPRRSVWRVAQFDTLRLRLIKLAARVEVLKRKVMLQLPRSTANQGLFACALTRLPRMLT